MNPKLKTLALQIGAACTALMLMLVHAVVGAEDIDIYTASAANGDLPNVLIILDTPANSSSNLVHNCKYREDGVLLSSGPSEHKERIGLQKCALHNVIDALAVGPNGEGRYNVALMMYGPDDGAYPRIAFTEASEDNKRQLLKPAVKGLGTQDLRNSRQWARSLHEAYLYYAGMAPRAGNISLADRRAFASNRYVSPSAGSCGRNYVIFISNGKDPTTNRNQDAALLSSLGGDTRQIDYVVPVKNYAADYSDEYARFMSNADVSAKEGGQAITTYTVLVPDGNNDQLANFTRGVAHQGGGRFYSAHDADALTQALLGIFQDVAEVDSAFVSASLPVSVNSRGTYLNQIFMGLFRPDGSAAPRWRGNLKQYRFDYDLVTDSLHLVDVNGEPAISPATGFFAPGAASYWSAASTYWVNEPMGTPETISDLPDGPVVEKGGAAQRLRSRFATSLTERKVYTCVACQSGVQLGSGAATRFETGNTAITSERLGTTSTERSALIDWVRGVDNGGDEKGPGAPTLVRPSVHGDVLHSRPVVVNYGGEPNRVVVYYGANDGMLHAVNGNPSGVDAGQEYWSFVPEEGFAKLKRLRNNTPAIRYSTTPDGLLGPQPRDYFVDGPLSFYQKVGAGGVTEKAFLYVAMRRGGRALYAFDVTNPLAPRLAWKKSNADIPVLGQTWSEARVARIRGSASPVLVLGAGYDPEAEDPEAPGAVSMGNAVLVLDAESGALLKQFETVRPVAADVSLIDSDYDGFIDRAYAADLGGTVHRIDFESGAAITAPAWSMTTLANLGSSGSRKIFYPPDVVLTRDFAVIMVGTGDREKPLDTSTTERFFTLIDTEMSKGVSAGFRPISYGDLVAQSEFESPGTHRGCFMTLDPGGEKIVNAPVTAGGITYFSSNRPTAAPSNSCNNRLGEAKVYGVPLVCQAPQSQVLLGGGLPPSPVTGTVAISEGTGPDGTPLVRRVPFIIGGFNTRKSGIEGSKVQVAVPPRRSRLYWFTEADR